MREIKFREWDPVREKILRKGMSYSKREEFDDSVNFRFDYEEDLDFSNRLEETDEAGTPLRKLMQYTGLKDENGNEVYLGDVIDIFWEEWPAGYYQENHLTGRVSFDETGTALVIKNAKYDWNNPVNIPPDWNGTRLSRSLPDEEELEEVFLHHFDLAPENITILGNIYENPELLEVAE